MMIGTIELDNDMLWIDEFQGTLVSGTAERALDGHTIVQVAPLHGGRFMTLSGGADFGWQKRSTVIALQALAEDSPTDPVEVTMPDNSTYTAYFRVEESPVVSFTPITNASAPDADFWYYGTINLRLE